MGCINDQARRLEQYEMGGPLQLSVADVVIFAMKPFSLCISVCLFSIKTTFIVIQTWMELAKAAVLLHMHIFWKVCTWTIALISLPKRILNALQRERLLDQNIKGMQFDMESLLWHMKKLEDHLEKVAKKCKLMEIMLVELEEEYESTVCKSEELQQELEDARNENLRMKEIQGKARRSFKAADHAGSGFAVGKNGGGPSKSSFEVGMLKAGTTTELIYTSKPAVIAEGLHVGEILSRQRLVAIVWSISSATLSLLIAMVIWKAQNSCISLMLALFTVVVMSLRSAFQVLSALEYKPAYEAVALVSFNMFILSILSYLMLLKLVHIWFHQ